MKTCHWKWFLILTISFAFLVLTGCNKKKAAVQPPIAPSIARPTASISADPSSVEKGQSATLSWKTTDADSVSLEGLGSVAANGSKVITPSESTTYEIVAKGSGGTADATTRVTVTVRPAPTAEEKISDSDLFGRNIKNVFFDFDKSDMRADQAAAIDSDAQFLQAHSGVKTLVEGHCDERGSIEYNLALGDHRAHAVKNALVRDGVNADRIDTITYGKERPFCEDHNEKCWQENRQGHFVYEAKGTGGE